MRAARRVDPSTALFAGAAAISAVLLIAWQWNLTFFYDDWDPLIDRPGLSPDVLLRPHIDHILLGTTLVYKAIQATIGMESLAPYGVASTATFLVSVTLLFVYVRGRVGGWLALAAVLPVLFLGAARDDLLWPFQIFFFGAMAFGLGALLLVERGGRNRDPVVCGLLVLSFTFSELALPFVLGVAVAIAQERGPLRRAYVVLVPLLLYTAWYLGWGHTAEGHLSFDNVANSPSYVLEGLASSVASLLGLTPGGLIADDALGWGRAILVALLLLTGLRLGSRPPISRWVWVSAVIVLSFWFLTGANAGIGRPPDASRYQYVGVVLLLLVAADLAGGVVRPCGITIGIAFGLAAISVLANVTYLHDRYVGLSGVTPTVRGGLAGLDIEADHVDPDLVLDQGNSGFNYIGSVRAGPYLSAVDDFGSPAYSESELPGAPERARVAADRVMGAALRIRLQPTAAPATPGNCATLHPRPGFPAVFSLPPGRAILEPAPGVTVRAAVRRFAADSFPVAAGTLQGAAVLAIPQDRSSRPWQLQLDGDGPVKVCGRRAA